MNRRITLLSPEITNLIVKQIGHELSNYTIYMSFAAYFARLGYTNLEEYYRKRANEEYNHHLWCVNYLIEADANFVYPAIEGVSEKFTAKNLIDPFILTVEREIETTQLIYTIKKLAESQDDFMTVTWLFEHLVKEQVEEENLSRMVQSIAEQEETPWLEKAKAILDLLD